VLAGLRESTPPQKILQNVIDGPVSELIREHSISSLDDLFNSVFSKLDLGGDFLNVFKGLLMKAANDHLISDILYKLSNTANETQFSDQILGIFNEFSSVMPFAKTFQYCLSFRNQAKAAPGANLSSENPMKKVFDYLLQEVQANPRVAQEFMNALIEVVMVFKHIPIQ
jgi:hypothetical protein